MSCELRVLNVVIPDLVGVNFLPPRAIGIRRDDILRMLAIAPESKAVWKQSQLAAPRNYVIVKPTCYTCWDVLHPAVGK